jgi:hypothetical protein
MAAQAQIHNFQQRRTRDCDLPRQTASLAPSWYKQPLPRATLAKVSKEAASCIESWKLRALVQANEAQHPSLPKESLQLQLKSQMAWPGEHQLLNT